MSNNQIDLIHYRVGKQLTEDNKRPWIRGYDNFDQMLDYLTACGVDQPSMTLAMVVATCRNLIQDQLEQQDKQEEIRK